MKPILDKKKKNKEIFGDYENVSSHDFFLVFWEKYLGRHSKI